MDIHVLNNKLQREIKQEIRRKYKIKGKNRERFSFAQIHRDELRAEDGVWTNLMNKH
jgi:hypothetical protein